MVCVHYSLRTETGVPRVPFLGGVRGTGRNVEWRQLGNGTGSRLRCLRLPDRTLLSSQDRKYLTSPVSSLFLSPFPTPPPLSLYSITLPLKPKHLPRRRSIDTHESSHNPLLPFLFPRSFGDNLFTQSHRHSSTRDVGYLMDRITESRWYKDDTLGPVYRIVETRRYRSKHFTPIILDRVLQRKS